MISSPEIKELRVHIRYVILWVFKNNNKNVSETVTGLCSVYDQSFITNR